MTQQAGERERVRATVEVARQLAAAVGSYRLFPGDVEQEAFVAAAGRVRALAATALAAGPIGFELRSGVLHVDGQAFPDDGNLGRFARDCYDRRVEHVTVSSAPSIEALATVGEALSEPVEESIAQGGPQRFLDLRGIRSISLDAAAPSAPTHLEALLAQLDPEARQLWQRLSDPVGFAASMIVGGLGSDAADGAESVYRRLKVLFEVFPAELVARGDVFAKMRRTLVALPAAVRREAVARVLTRAGTEAFATSFVNDTSDIDLTEALLDVAAVDGPDPLDLARRVVDATGRGPTVVEMVGARTAGRDGEGASAAAPHRVEDTRGRGGTAARGAGGEDEVGAVTALALGETTRALGSTLADVLGERLLDTTHADARAIREEWPVDEGAQASLTYDALRDYLALEGDTERLEAVLERWVDTARDAIVSGSPLRLEALITLLDHPVRVAADDARRRRFAAAKQRVPSPDLIGEIVTAALDERRADAVVDLLRPFGGAAVDAVVDRLGVEEDRGVRSQLVRIAAGLAPGHLDQLADRLGDPRWFVVRNVVTILGRTQDPGAVPILVRLLRHDAPNVRRETIRALVSTAGSDGVPYVRRLADDPDAGVRQTAVGALAGLRLPVAAQALADVAARGEHLDERQRAITALGEHPAQNAGALLEGLAGGRGADRLPRPLRKVAKSAAQARRGR